MNIHIHAARIKYLTALANMKNAIEAEMQGIDKNKLPPSSHEYFYQLGQELTKARGELSKAMTLGSILDNGR